MEPKFRYSESTEKPLSIEMKTDCVYLRKNITTDIRSYNETKTTYWTYEEAYFTLAEFNSYANAIAAKNAVEGVNNASNIVEILSQQITGGDNQLAIMDAIADLYEAIAAI